jgi:hypothetical protein
MLFQKLQRCLQWLNFVQVEADDWFGRVEDRRGSLGPVANAPFPIPPGRRRQLPASGSHRT